MTFIITSPTAAISLYVAGILHGTNPKIVPSIIRQGCGPTKVPRGATERVFMRDCFFFHHTPTPASPTVGPRERASTTSILFCKQGHHPSTMGSNGLIHSDSCAARATPFRSSKFDYREFTRPAPSRSPTTALEYSIHASSRSARMEYSSAVVGDLEGGPGEFLAVEFDLNGSACAAIGVDEAVGLWRDDDLAEEDVVDALSLGPTVGGW